MQQEVFSFLLCWAWNMMTWSHNNLFYCVPVFSVFIKHWFLGYTIKSSFAPPYLECWIYAFNIEDFIGCSCISPHQRLLENFLPVKDATHPQHGRWKVQGTVAAYRECEPSSAFGKRLHLMQSLPEQDWNRDRVWGAIWGNRLKKKRSFFFNLISLLCSPRG